MLSRKNLLVALLLTSALTASASGAPSEEPPWPVLHPEPLTFDLPAPHGPQFVGADAKGRVVIVRGSRPEFFEVREDGSIRTWGDPEDRQAVPEGRGPGIFAASRGPDGRWFLASPDRLFVVSRHGVDPLPRLPLETTAVALVDHPVAAVLPVIQGKVTPRFFESERPPLLVELTSSGWGSHHEEDFSDVEGRAPENPNTHRAFRALDLAVAGDGGLWAAHRYLYRVRRFGESGKETLELTLAPHPEIHEMEEDQVEELRARLAERAMAFGDDVAVEPFTASPVIGGMAEGRDGKLYLYIPPGVFGGQPLLDRYDPLALRLERAALGIDHPGRVTLAAGKDGLWIAAVGSSRALWRIGWPALEALEWKTVPGLHLDGVPTEP